jgi:transposase
MQGKKTPGSKLFYTLSIDKLVPQDHPVRKISEVLDLNFLYEETREYYSHEGKPSIDPVVLFKLYILGYFFGVRSERQLFREVQVNLAYRWYLGYDLDEEIPDHSIMTKSRYRFPLAVFERVFKRIIHMCKERGLVSGDYYFVDSSLVRANAAKESFRTKLLTEAEYLEGLKRNEEERAEFHGHVFDGKIDPDKMGKRRRRKKKNDILYSTTDPDAELVTRPGKGTFAAYKAHLCVDRKARVIVSLEGSKATEDDMSKVPQLYSAAVFSVGKKPKVVTGDKHYGGIEALKYFQDQGIRTCISPRISDNRKGKYKNTDFTIIGEESACQCPAGHITTKTKHHQYRLQFKWPKTVCNGCSLKERCTTSDHGRMVTFYKGSYFKRAKELVESPMGKKLLCARQVIVEGVIGEAKTLHLLDRCRYRSLQLFNLQLFLTASVINLKRLLKIIGYNHRTGIERFLFFFPVFDFLYLEWTIFAESRNM